MSGKKIADHQVQKHKQHHLKLSQVAAAAKAGISERSARRIDFAPTRPEALRRAINAREHGGCNCGE